MADNSQLYSMTCQQLNYILEFWENCPFLRKYNYLIWVSHTLGGFVIILGVIYFRRFVNAILGLTKLFWKKRKQRWVSRSLGLPSWVRVSACKKKSSSGFCRVRPRPVASLVHIHFAENEISKSRYYISKNEKTQCSWPFFLIFERY